MNENNEVKVEENQTSTAGNTYLIPGAIILAGFLVAGAIVYSNSKTGPATQGSASVIESQRQAAQDLADDDPFIGNPDAPVTIVEFGDFQCPFCARFFQETEQQIIEKYVKTGKVKFVYRDFPLTNIHEHAQKSAEAAECADEQGKFWPYHDILFERQESLGSENYKVWAAELGLNVQQFNSCLDSGKYADEVQKDLNDGQLAGVNGTPATFVNGRLIQGAVPYAQFAAVIEEELKKSK